MEEAAPDLDQPPPDAGRPMGGVFAAAAPLFSRPGFLSSRKKAGAAAGGSPSAPSSFPFRARVLGARKSAGEDADRTVYLHVGIHKTASTYIQNRLRRNLPLLARHRLRYLPLRRHHLSLVRAVKQRDRAPWLALLAEAEASHSHILLSAEAFSLELAKPTPENPQEVVGEWLHRLIHEQGWRLRLIAFIRDQPSYLNSRYTQLVKRLHTTSSFEAYVRRVTEGRSESECNFMTLFGWVFRHSDLVASFIPFGGSLAMDGDASRSRQDPFAQLLAQLPLPAGLTFAEAPASSANQQPGRMGVQLARHFGRYLKQHHPERLAEEAYRSAARQRIEGWASTHQWQEEPFNGLSPELWQRIRHHYAESNAAFVQAAWGEPLTWSFIFGSEPSPPLPSSEPPEDTAMLEALVDQLLSVLPPSGTT